MLRSSLAVVVLLVAIAGCPGGGGGLGDACGGNDDCDGTLQCLNSRCVLRCDRAPDCGDGYSCDSRHLCQPAVLDAGEPCRSEVECKAGLSCRLSGAVEGSRLLSTCTVEKAARPAGEECSDDDDCRHGTCALGHCIDLCGHFTDCSGGNSCVSIPHLVLDRPFSGCLPSNGAVTWSVPLTSPSAEILLPVPETARSASLVMRVDDLSQKVGAATVTASGTAMMLYSAPCYPFVTSDPPCDPIAAQDKYFAGVIRHLPALGQSVLTLPSRPTEVFGPTVYRARVSSFRPSGAPGSAIPRVTAVVQLGSDQTANLDLHFFFLDLAEHPCVTIANNATLDATTAKTAKPFQEIYLAALRTMFFRADIKLDTTYENIPDRHDLDGLDVADVGDLLALGKYPTGINVFFVRSLSPIGIQAFGPNPGPAGLAGTRQSGIVISLDTLCYRDWTTMARITAHEIARYMGLYHNVEVEAPQHPSWQDMIDDNDEDPNDNLMFYSELGGTRLSRGQNAVLIRSAVLR